MQKYKSNITTTSGAAVRGVPVLVIDEDGNNAALFLDRAGTVPAPNPLTTGPDGVFYFYAVNGRYSLRTTVDGVTITDDDVVLMMDPEEITVAGPIAEAVAAAQAAATAAETAVANSGIPVLVSSAQNAVVDANAALAQAIASSSSAALSKTDADAARDAAVTAKMAAEAALDSFDGRYLGAKAVAPTVDNDGAALLIGALYWDTALPGMRSWNGSAWVTLQSATAAAISNTPAGSIAATTVQSAIDELDAEKAPLSSPALTGTPTAPTAAPGTNTTQIATTEYARAAAIAFGGIKAYATKAEAAIASALLPDGSDIEVAQDESLSGSRTRYKAQGGALVFVVNLDQTRIDIAAATGASLVGGASQVVNSIAALRTLLKTSASKNARVTGYYAAGDGGGGAYYYDSTDTTTADNGGTVIVAADGGRWKLEYQSWVNARQFGAKGDGVADDTAALQAAIAYVSNTYNRLVSTSPWGGTCRLLIPAGYYKLTDSIIVNSKVAVEGEGQSEYSSGTRLLQTVANKDVFTLTPTTGSFSFSVENIVFVNNVTGTGNLITVNNNGVKQVNSQRYIGCTFSNPQNQALILTGDDIVVENCLFDVSGFSGFAVQLGTATGLASNVRISGCNFFNIPNRCIAPINVNGCVISGNRVSQPNTATYTIYFFDSITVAPTLIKGVAITGNVLRGVVMLLGIRGMTDVVFSGNMAYDGGNAGASHAFYLNGPGIANISITGNEISGSYGGLNVFNDSTATSPSNIIVANNNFVNTGGAGACLAITGSTGIFAPNIFYGYLVNATAPDFLSRGMVNTGLVNIPYGASINTDAARGTYFTISVTNGAAFTINTPTNPSAGQEITYAIINNFGTLGAVTWGAGFRLAAWVQPAGGGFRRTITFRYSGAAWHEVSRNATDIPNS